MNELNGHDFSSLADTVAGDDLADVATEPSIYIRGEFVGGDPDQTRMRDVSVTIPVRPHDTYADYAVAIETAVREIGHLGYLPGYKAPDVTVEKR